jgi:phospholipase C
MRALDRRRFLQLSGGTVAASVLLASIDRAAAIPPYRRTQTISDVEHIVVLMQENRAFDHYFGTLRGVRGFGDPRPVLLPSGKDVWHQSDGARDVLPFHPGARNLGLKFLEDLDHGWDSGHQAFHGGNYDQWIPAKTATTMAYLDRQDIPFHYALADAFTICDAYHCSVIGPTDPNRFYLWSGCTGNDGQGRGPVIANDELGYGWRTYPERLEQAGISWKVYQDSGLGLDATHFWGRTVDPYIGNYGVNSLLYFDAYRSAPPTSPLYQKARTGTDANHGEGFFDILRADVIHDWLPQVSWIVAPEAFTEHGNWPANYGPWYVAQVLDALTSNPDVWSKTALFLTYDENDGFFDHVVPPYPPPSPAHGASTVDVSLELYPGSPAGTPGPYGLGQRVPMIVISPWSTGGWVCSEVFDHTSILRFMEQRFAVMEPNISPWRRAVCGDLTAAFNFGEPDASVPPLPSTAGYAPSDDQRHTSYIPKPPSTGALPAQEPGTRQARAVGYDLRAHGRFAPGSLTLRLTAAGALGAAFQVRSQRDPAGPWTYTVGAGATLSATFAPATRSYDYTVHGPDGFYRQFTGTTARAGVDVTSVSSGTQLTLTITNRGETATLAVVDAYRPGVQQTLRVPHGGQRSLVVDTAPSSGWYDVALTSDRDTAFVRRLAGHLETGQPSTSDPKIG